jgi:16S rRNA (guanine527-N7)-methyltransferase
LRISGPGLIKSYFPGIDQVALQRFEQLEDLYAFWNERINVISRKDLANLYLNHILHSLSLEKVVRFMPGEKALDIGTGGGFPGIPLAILNPGVHFTLIDSRMKKIRVVKEVASALSLGNVEPVAIRAEDIRGEFHYIFSRAAGSFPLLVEWSAGKILKGTQARDVHGLYSLKGGDLDPELSSWKDKVRIYEIGNFFQEDFFKAKKIVFLSHAWLPD